MDKYTRIKKIGEGSFGKALLVRCKESGKQLVVKEINMGRMSKKERDEARKETAVLAQLLHPNIVMYRESFEEVGNLFIVMDYCDGGDLYGRINSQRGILFQEDQILDWFVQICLSIKHIHDRKILHRDIKSQNIFLTRHGIVKLGDFGIAKVLNSTVELARTCIGTPYYLSPEICENKPYNNKSDIWSLGCVLYEMTTLKHAFEAGNMKNLVLKIIRGSYPPVPPRYSYEIRNLIAQLFKRNARDRPSINNVLRKPLLTNRIKKFLNDTEIAEEFSHTVMHGAVIKKALPPGQNRPQPVKASNVAAKRPPTPSTPRYNPASVYAPSSARRPNSAKNVRKSNDDVKRPPSAGRRPPSADGGVADAAKRRQELMEKERKRREEELKKKEERYAKAHKDLAERQKVARMNRAREEGWKSLLDDDYDRRSVASPSPRNSYDDPPQRVQPKPIAPKPTPYPQYPPSGAGQAKYYPYQPGPVAHRGNYDQYHAYLNKLQQDRDRANAMSPNAGGGGYLGANAAHAARRAEAVSARSRESAQNAKHIDEYLQRKKEAMMNKARGQNDMLGLGAARAMGARPVSAGGNPSSRPPSGRPVSARDAHKENQEDEYLARLRQIRLQNFNERRQLQDKMAGKADPKYKPPIDQRQDPEFRKKKIEALRQQADERASRLKAELEKKRKEAHELERKRQQLAAKMNVPAKRAVNDAPKPAPVFPMTHAMKAIGAAKSPPPSATPKPAGIGMTAALSAIGAKQSDSDPQRAQSPLEEQKKQVLKRLNERVSSSQERGRWGQPVKPMAQERSKWEEGGNVPLGDMSLEQTASKMEVTSARDHVVKHDLKSKEQNDETEPPPSARRQWGGPRGTVVKELHAVKLHETGQADETPEEKKEGTGEIHNAPKVGSTITIAKNPSGKGTVVIRKVGDAHPHDKLDVPTIDDSLEEKTDEKQVEISAADIVECQDDHVVEDDVKVEEVEEEITEVAPEMEETKNEEVSTAVVEESETVVEPVEDPEDTQEPENEITDESVQGADGRPIFESLARAAGEGPSGEPKRDKTDLNAEQPPNDESETQPTKKNAKFVMGLTTGHFDIDRALLRTCSEPDLSKLFKTNIPDNPFLFSGAMSLDADALERLEEEMELDEDEGSNGDEAADTQAYEEALVAASQNAANEDDATESAQDDSEDPTSETRSQEAELEEDSDEDDEDLETLRESMMSLLQNDEAEEEGPEKEELKKKGKKVVKKCKKKKKVLKSRVKKTAESGGQGDAAEYIRELSNTSEEDFATIRETMWTILEAASKMKEKTRKPVETIAENKTGEAEASEGKLQSTLVPGRETWQSDSDNEEDDYFEEDDNMFSRLEETRAKLETELGCDTFLKAYKTVQAIHEDEDENMEEGVGLVTSILGQEKSHLYPSILQLVMADGVFAEDNN